jgi:hypothetical protein
MRPAYDLRMTVSDIKHGVDTINPIVDVLHYDVPGVNTTEFARTFMMHCKFF